MKYAKFVSILLVLCLAFTGTVLAQQEEKGKQAKEEAKQAYEPVSYTHLTLPTTPYV